MVMMIESFKSKWHKMSTFSGECLRQLWKLRPCSVGSHFFFSVLSLNYKGQLGLHSGISTMEYHLLRTLGGNRWSFMWCFNRHSIHLTCNGKMEEYCMEKLLLPTTQSPGLSAYWGQSSNSSAFVSLPAPSLVAQPIFIYHGATWCNTQKPAVQKSPPQNLPVFSLWNQGQEHCVT